MHFTNAINLFSQRAYEIQFISSDQTQKHSFQLPLPKAFLLRKFHFSYDLIYWNEIPDIRQKVMGSVIKYWNHIRTFAFVIFGPKSSNDSDRAYFENPLNISLASAQILRISRQREVQAVDMRTVFYHVEFYANIYTQSDSLEHMKLCCSIVFRQLDNLFIFLSVLNLIRTKFSFHKTNFGLNNEKQFVNHINNFKDSARHAKIFER
jgi:hypothetical protein